MRKMATEKIAFHTKVEGGDWIRTTSSYCSLPPDESLDLSKLRSRDNVALVNGMLIHSFRTSEGREWDVINGWRQK